jgi:hypothetical protein
MTQGLPIQAVLAEKPHQEATDTGGKLARLDRRITGIWIVSIRSILHVRG